jgi:hypothetical protein
MNVMDKVVEGVMEGDGGLFCPHDCENAGPLPVLEANSTERVLVSDCPEHGRFTVDVSGEYDELLAEAIEDERYQQGDQELGLQRDMETEG